MIERIINYLELKRKKYKSVLDFRELGDGELEIRFSYLSSQGEVDVKIHKLSDYSAETDDLGFETRPSNFTYLIYLMVGARKIEIGSADKVAAKKVFDLVKRKFK